MSYYPHALIDYYFLIEKYGADRILKHMAHCLVKIERIVYNFDKTWTGTVEDLPATRAVGLFGIFDATGFAFDERLSKEGK